ncbi:EMI domain-containing protein 1-like [Ahaetulla prasina]|uniref:EMI domain-containing protein 1-like n=1 Tax=Ahaetulla prasina TaxID=499056 RepID=UPI002648E747|nr:EMI domain-containing protein 1-like [Ahaetulla prasina]
MFRGFLFKRTTERLSESNLPKVPARIHPKSPGEPWPGEEGADPPLYLPHPRAEGKGGSRSLQARSEPDLPEETPASRRAGSAAPFLLAGGRSPGRRGGLEAGGRAAPPDARVIQKTLPRIQHRFSPGEAGHAEGSGDPVSPPSQESCPVPPMGVGVEGSSAHGKKVPCTVEAGLPLLLQCVCVSLHEARHREAPLRFFS